MASVLEVVNGISQALHAKHYGGQEFGLKRESEHLLQGVSIYDPRVMDGFGVQFQGDRLVLKYHSEMPLAKVHDKNFEVDIRSVIKDITKHLKEEYRKVTKQSLSLKEEGDIQILVQTANRRTCYVNAAQVYKLSDIEIDSGKDAKSKKVYDSEQEHFADIAKRWLMNTKGD
jgi:hypothetical protein